MAALHHAIDSGVNLLTRPTSTAGRSERLIAKLKKDRGQNAEIIVATKAGRRLPRQTVEGYSRENLTGWIDDSLRNLSTDTLDLVQLHCPPTALYDRPEVLGMLDDLVKAGKIRFYGVSVEKIEEALKAIEFPNVQGSRSSSIASVSVLRSLLARAKLKELAFWRSATGQRVADKQAAA
jgi:aryl-alcohol dehydrogenase-like predicted oxidoreductase